jgi:hypothetical protein
VIVRLPEWVEVARQWFIPITIACYYLESAAQANMCNWRAFGVWACYATANVFLLQTIHK